MRACVCVCVRKSNKKRERVCVIKRERDRETERAGGEVLVLCYFEKNGRERKREQRKRS